VQADKDTLHRGIPLLAAEEQSFIDRVFATLDANASGGIDWPEFVNLMAAMEMGSREKQATFLFQVRAFVHGRGRGPFVH
jgi:hypothetical protein